MHFDTFLLLLFLYFEENKTQSYKYSAFHKHGFHNSTLLTTNRSVRCVIRSDYDFICRPSLYKYDYCEALLSAEGQIIMHFLPETRIWTHKGNTQVTQQKFILYAVLTSRASMEDARAPHTIPVQHIPHPVSWFTCSISNDSTQPISRQGPTLVTPPTRLE